MPNLEDLAQIEELNCSICQERYGDDQRNPRNLPCGHTFCSHCLGYILEEEDPLCPECRKEIPIARVQNFPVSYVVKKMIVSYKDVFAKIQAEVLQSAHNCACDPTIDDDKRNSHGNDSSSAGDSCQFSETTNSPSIPSHGTCSFHQSPMNFFCNTCGLWICGTCAFFDHKNDKKCEVEFVKDAHNILKIDIKHKVTEQRNIMKSAIVILNKFKGSTLDMYSNGKAPSEDVVAINAVIRKVVENVNEINDSCDILDDVEEMFQVETLEEIKKLSTYVNNLWECQQYPKSLEDFLWDLWPYIKESIECFESVKLKTCITTQLDGRTLFSEFFARDDYILLVSFEESHPKGDYFPLKLKCIIDDAPINYTFMEFCCKTESKYLGRVIFSVMDTGRGRHFLNLCAGTHGPCYKGTRFFRKIGTYVCFIEGGDYEHDNGDGGKQLYDVNGVELCKMEEGIVCGPDNHRKDILSQFKICYEIKNFSFHDARGPIARVIEGLDIIKDISDMESDYKDVYISECGLCIAR